MLMGGAPYPESYDRYRAEGGYLALETAVAMGSQTIIEYIKAAGLRGRGGSGFPTGIKWEAVASQTGPKVVMMNGEEGEPGSQKDVWLCAHRPHLVLEGMWIAACAMEADQIFLYLSDQAAEAEIALRHAVTEMMGHRHHWPAMPWPRIVVVPHTYVAGEETSAIAAAEGSLAIPRFKPPRPFEAGVDGLPTLVQNTETLANVPAILRDGPAVFRSQGTVESPGTVLAMLLGAIRRPGLYEIPLGTPLVQVITEYAGGLEAGRQWQGALVGGYFGGFIAADPIVRLDYESIRAAGGGLGNAEITVLDDRSCPVQLAETVTQFFARESCGQCGVCQRLTRTVADLVARIRQGGIEPASLVELARYGQQMHHRGACALPDGTVTAVRTLLQVFRPAVESHAARGVCDACRPSV